MGKVEKEALVKGARENREAIRTFAEKTLGWEVKDDEITAIVVKLRPSSVDPDGNEVLMEANW